MVLSAAVAPRSDSSGVGSSQVARNSLKMTVIDAGNFSKIEDWSMDVDKFSNRVSSLTNDSCQFLKGEDKPASYLPSAFTLIPLPAIGAWDHVEQSRTCPVEEMQVCTSYIEPSHF